MPPIRIIDTDTRPRCPYCERYLDHVERTTQVASFITHIYLCPHCHKVLPVQVDRLP